MDRDEVLEVLQGALVVKSNAPVFGNLERGLENNTVWAPKLLVAIPNKNNPFEVYPNAIKLKNTDYVIKRDNGAGVWYGDKDIEEGLNLRGYSFIPGDAQNSKLNPMYVFENSFIPDLQDVRSTELKRENVALMPCHTFSYSESAAHRIFAANVMTRELPNFIYNQLSAAPSFSFGYDCSHSGTVGLHSKMHGCMKISEEQARDAWRVICKDLRDNLNLKFE